MAKNTFGKDFESRMVGPVIAMVEANASDWDCNYCFGPATHGVAIRQLGGKTTVLTVCCRCRAGLVASWALSADDIAGCESCVSKLVVFRGSHKHVCTCGTVWNCSESNCDSDLRLACESCYPLVETGDYDGDV